MTSTLVTAERRGDPDRAADRDERGAATDDLPDDARGLLAERDADAIVAGAAPDVVRDHAVDADRAEHQRKPGEQRQQRHHLPGGPDRQVEHDSRSVVVSCTAS